jgi:hypothetical protein
VLACVAVLVWTGNWTRVAVLVASFMGGFGEVASPQAVKIAVTTTNTIRGKSRAGTKNFFIIFSLGIVESCFRTL